MSNRTNTDSMTVTELILTVVPLPFCLNTLIVLVYFIRSVVKLRRELRSIPLYKLIKQETVNYILNIKIHLKISGCIIVILIFELFENISFILYLLPVWGRVVNIGSHLHSLIKISNSVIHITFATRLTYISLLSCVMDFLWQVYRKYECKYTMRRWAVYIVIRGLVIAIWLQSVRYMSYEYKILAKLLLSSFYVYFFVSDFIQFVYYAKRFYSYLKSREKEVLLFYFDRGAYIYHRWIRIHFLISTLLVTNALFLFTLSFSITSLIYVTYGVVELFNSQDYPALVNVPASLNGDVIMPTIILFKVLFNINYLYIIIVLIFKSLRDRSRLYSINRHIRPIMEVYRNSIHHGYA